MYKYSVYRNPMDVPLLCMDNRIDKCIKEYAVSSEVPKGSLYDQVYPLVNIKLLGKLCKLSGYDIESFRCIPYTLKSGKSPDEFVSVIDEIYNELDLLFSHTINCVIESDDGCGDSYSNSDIGFQLTL